MTEWIKKGASYLYEQFTRMPILVLSIFSLCLFSVLAVSNSVGMYNRLPALREELQAELISGMEKTIAKAAEVSPCPVTIHNGIEVQYLSQSVIDMFNATGLDDPHFTSRAFMCEETKLLSIAAFGNALATGVVSPHIQCLVLKNGDKVQTIASGFSLPYQGTQSLYMSFCPLSNQEVSQYQKGWITIDDLMEHRKNRLWQTRQVAPIPGPNLHKPLFED